MIKCQGDVVGWVADLVGDRRRQTTNHCSFLRLMKLSLEFACTSEFCSHLIKCGRECPHFVVTFSRDSKFEVASSHLSRGNRKFLYRPREAPHKETCN